VGHISVGLVGFGLAGRYLHAPLIAAAGLHLAAIVTRQLDEVRRCFPDARVCASLTELLAEQQIDLVVVATPNHLHATQAAEALAAGKHVVVDKPMTIRAHEADELIARASARKRVLSVFHNRRWDSDFLTLRELISSGRLGEPSAFQMRWDRFRPEVRERWRERAEAGGGVLYDLAPHLIDQALTLFGWPDWVQADVFAQRDRAATDDAFEILMARGSLRISLGASSLAPDGSLRYRVHGTRASFIKSGLDVQESQLLNGHDPLAVDFGMEPEQQWGRLVNADGSSEIVPSARGSWLEFYRAMGRSIESGEPPPVPASQARDVLRVIEAVLRSSQERRRIELA
jgi:scyllo-inositol 2-dehydrogenase (NADP+)